MEDINRVPATEMVLVALGSNIPLNGMIAPRAVLEAALAALGERGLRPLAASRWYRSPAWPPGAGPDFVNGAAAFRSAMGPRRVLAVLHEVEAALGRARRERWAPRSCDLDLLAIGATVLPDREAAARWIALAPEVQREEAPGELILPHPRMHERAFVLKPLAEIAPEWVHPVLGATVRALLDALPEEARAEVVPL